MMKGQSTGCTAQKRETLTTRLVFGENSVSRAATLLAGVERGVLT
jgi:hypothetical protein